MDGRYGMSVTEAELAAWTEGYDAGVAAAYDGIGKSMAEMLNICGESEKSNRDRDFTEQLTRLMARVLTLAMVEDNLDPEKVIGKWPQQEGDTP